MNDNSTGMGRQPGTRKAIFYGWWVVLALVFIIMLGPMARYSLTALSPFIQEEFGWTKSQMGMAFTLHLWIYSFLVMPIGWMIDRFGSRRIIFVGGLTVLVALVLLSRINTLWQLYVVFGVVTSLAVGMTHFVPTLATSRRWFVVKAGFVSGIVTAAFSIGTALLSPALTLMSAALGWRGTWLTAAVVFGVIIMLLSWLIVRDTPESMGLHPDGFAGAPQKTRQISPTGEQSWTAKQALHTRTFWLLFISYALGGFTIQAMLTQIVLWATDLGQSLATAGIFLTALSIPSIPAKILGGWLGDKFGKLRVLIWGAAACTLVMAAAWLTAVNTTLLFIIAVLWGLAYGAPQPLFPSYLGDLYGRASLGTLIGVQTFGVTLFGAFGPLVWSVTADATGSYRLGCLISAVLYAASLVTLVLMKPAKQPAPVK